MQYRLVLQQLAQAQPLVFPQREQLEQQLQQLVPEQLRVQAQAQALQRLEREQRLQQLVQVLQRQV
jgi:galactokinase